MNSNALKISTDLIHSYRDKLQREGIVLPNLRDSESMPNIPSSAALGPYLDATYLSPAFSLKAVNQLCDFAIKHNCASVCVAPYFAEMIKKRLEKTSTRLCSVADFPFGSGSTALKVSAIKTLVSEGCDEVDFVINYSNLIESDQYVSIFEQLSLIREAVPKTCLKAIIETSYLNDEQIVVICALLDASKIDFAKTSTGFSKAGASVENIKLMYASSSNNLKLKASGGISSLNFAQDLIAVGASRLGTSKAEQLLTDI